MPRLMLSLLLTVVTAGVLAQDGAGTLGPTGDAGDRELTGSLAIRAVQGTAEGRSPAGNPVEVHLFHRGEAFRTIDAELDDLGVLVLSDIPVAMGVRPLVRIEHDGVVYQEAGPEMTPESPNAALDVVIYDTTSDRPAWTVASRQVVVTPAIGKVLVSESVYVENPNDKTWLGDERASNDKLTTVKLGLPENAGNVNLDAGFHGWCCTTFESGTLGVQLNLMPGRSVYQYSYEVPAIDGTVKLALGAEATTEELAVIVPETGVQAEPEGLSPGSVQMSEEGPLRLYVGRSVAPDQSPAIRLAGLAPPPPPPSTDPDVLPAGGGSGGGLDAAMWVGAGVVAAGALFAIAMAVRRKG